MNFTFVQFCSIDLMHVHKEMALSSQKWARTLVAVSEATLGCTEFDDFNRDVIKYCSEGQIHEALILMHRVVQEGIWHSFNLYSCLLKACISANFLIEGKQVHNLIVESGYNTNIFLENTLIDMYSKCGSLCDASHIFNNMRRHNIFSYTAIISAYTVHGESEKAVEVFHLMQSTGLMPDKFVFTLVLKSCAILGALAYGRHAHSFFIVSGLEPDAFVTSTLIDMYAKCSTVSDSHRVFDDANAKDVIVWTSMIASYAQQGDKEAVLQLFNQMQLEGIHPNRITCLTILKVCSSSAALEDGRRLHTFILGNGMEFDVALSNTLVDMYAKCSSINDACHLFDKIVSRNVVSWNVMITAYVEARLNNEAVMLFEEMQEKGVTPNQLTLVAVLKGCVQLENVELGMSVHACIVEILFEVDNFLQSNLLDMYAKCGSMKDARKVFNDMDKANVVSWTTLIAGYTREGHGKEALALFERMKQECVNPDEIAISSALNACASLGALQHGKRIHEEIMNGLYCQVMVRNALIDMYAKCGSLRDASEVLASQQGLRDVVSWNTIISGYAQQGIGKQALQYFEKMLEEGQKPDNTTFLAVLTACRHAGLVEQGRQHFDSMSQDYGILPTMDHYACMVDLLCRAGHVDEAEAFILKMEVEPDALVWMSLLGGCRCRGHIETAKRAYKHILKLNATLPGAYVIMSNIFATAGMWKDLAKVRKEMDLLGFRKKAGHTWIEVEDEIHMFSGADRSHPRVKDIQAELKRLALVMKEAGYRPKWSNTLDSTEYDEEEAFFCEHSEKLAVAYGLISTSPGTPIRITKNLRVCGDCHADLKMISEIEGREIFARDASRFHHFNCGVCSCGDYW